MFVFVASSTINIVERGDPYVCKYMCVQDNLRNYSTNLDNSFIVTKYIFSKWMQVVFYYVYSSTRGPQEIEQ